MFKYIISYDGGQLRDSGDFECGLFDSYGKAEESANNAKEENTVENVNSEVE